jgi:hypothetical protein
MVNWMGYYVLIIILIVPISVCVVINTIIFKYVQSSSNRIQPGSQLTTANDNNNQRWKLNRQDIHLLRHMVIMFFVFVIGWTPIYITSAISSQITVNPLILRILSLVTEISLLCDIIDLFLYSHKLKEYFQRIFFPCYHG